MTTPPESGGIFDSVSNMVRNMTSRVRTPSLNADERRVGIHLRGNEELFLSLRNLLLSRIEGRSRIAEPSDPIQCKSLVARDREIQWAMSRLEVIFHSPAVEPVEEQGEQPA